jgi:hypothetical protein
VYGPKPDRFVKKGDRLKVEERQLKNMPRNLAITHAGLLNPNFVKETCLGYWREYKKAASSRPTKPALDDAIQSMMRTLDAALATISKRIRALDPDTYTRMRFSHRPIIKAALNDVGQLKHADAHKKGYGKHPKRATTSSARIGGRDSMLVVSTSTRGGNAFHYDQGDAGKPFTCLERTVY